MINKENENSYYFQADWFSPNIPVWQELLKPFANKPNLHFLEIGSFEGRSTIWLIDNILTHPSSRIVCVDTFEGSTEHAGMGINTSNIEKTFLHNVKVSGGEQKVDIRKGYSQEILRTFPFSHFDFAYIDGSHVASDVLTDAVLTFPLLKLDGVLAFDDYHWDMDPNPLNRPQIAIKAFMEVFREKYQLLHKGDQIFLKKTLRNSLYRR